MSIQPYVSSVLVLGNTFEVRCSVPTMGLQRVSDLLNESRFTWVVENAKIVDAKGKSSTAEVLSINRSEVVLVIPVREERESPDNTWRVTKERIRARVHIRDWVIEGDIHVRGSNLDSYLNVDAGNFIPLTNAQMTGPIVDPTEDQVLVSKNHIQLIARIDDLPKKSAPKKRAKTPR